MEVLLSIRDMYQCKTVSHRKRNADGELIGHLNAKLILDTQVYESVFPVGEGMEVSSNRVADSILTYCDRKGTNLSCLGKSWITGLTTRSFQKKTAVSTVPPEH